MVYCNECKANFEPKVRNRYIEKDIEEVFFNCPNPNCHERYTAYYTNNSIKKKQKQLNRLPASSPLKNILKKQIENEMNILEQRLGTQ